MDELQDYTTSLADNIGCKRADVAQSACFESNANIATDFAKKVGDFNDTKRDKAVRSLEKDPRRQVEAFVSKTCTNQSTRAFVEQRQQAMMIPNKERAITKDGRHKLGLIIHILHCF